MSKFCFTLRHESRAVVISGMATVFGDYDGSSKPEAMIRALLANAHDVHITFIPENGDVDTSKESS